MKQTMDFDRTIADWLHADGPADIRSEVVDSALESARSTGQRRGLFLALAGPAPWPAYGRRIGFGTLPPALRVLVVTVLITALLAATVVFIGSQRRVSRGAAHNGAIVALDGSGDPYRAVALAPDGTTKDLGIHVAWASCPTFSPDGRSLAYVGSTTNGGYDQLAVVNADGSGHRALWSGPINPQGHHQIIWSRTGGLVAATQAGTASQIQLVIGQMDGGPAIVLDWGVGDGAGTLAWSPDGDRLAGITYLPGQEVWAIELRDLRGGNATRVVSALGIGSVAWSPDGSAIAYTASDDRNGANHLHVVGVDGSNPRAIGPGSPGSEGFMAWSPDGTRLAVLVVDDEQGTFSTRVLDDRGVDIARLGPYEATNPGSFTWAPDGSALLFTTAGGHLSRNDVHPLIVPLDGGPARTVGVGNGFYGQCPLGWQAVFP